jgi:hypothetical protein
VEKLLRKKDFDGLHVGARQNKSSTSGCSPRFPLPVRSKGIRLWISSVLMEADSGAASRRSAEIMISHGKSTGHPTNISAGYY